MNLNKQRKEFIKKLAGGIYILMNDTHVIDEIVIQPINRLEEYIKDNIILYERNSYGIYRHWFSLNAFCDFIDEQNDKFIMELLTHLDDIGLPLWRVFSNSLIHDSWLSDDERYYITLIETQSIETFRDFLEL